ncbi:hypothetical protein Acor_06120 [Acrocarpospora corrugata]|uniref:Uncharacterized protein n=1 Tax=Acrocarpospora corrugata TaxID=35763 RepID=A0A5M3VUY5_9ACTN|nr:hypothetical protein [Acrocarpospora corrugata]GER98550.1 hypothetical protein Acor_06120 [Acrocarpospora corrugata]
MADPPHLAVDPSVPFPVAALLRTHHPLLLEVRRGRVPDKGGADRPLAIFTGTVLLVTAVVGGPVALLSMLGVIGVCGLLWWLAGDPEQRDLQRRLRSAYAHADRFVLPEDLDEQCGSLLARAQRAVRAVLSSAVHREGLLDTIDNDQTLPEEVWQVAVRLADLSARRAAHFKIVGADPHPLIAEAVRPYDLAIETATASLTARVAALEAYAEQAVEADRCFEARRKLAELEELTPEYERLLAETAPDTLAVSQIARMSTHAAAVEQVFRASIAEARKAGTHLLSVTAA